MIDQNKKVRILCLRIDEKQASYRYRIKQFEPYWSTHNIEFVDRLIVGQSFIKRWKLINEAGDFDFVLLQRKTLSAIFIRKIKRKSRLIYDYDDALYAVESYKKSKPKDSQPGSKTMIRRLNFILKKADMVFAGSPALKAYSEKFSQNVFLVPTSLPVPKIHETIEKSDQIRIGWIGNRANLFFLNHIDDPLYRIQIEHPNVIFTVMCSDLPIETRTQWKLTKWSKESEQEWLESIDIGLMPLEDDEWSRGKCAFKLIQYMSYKKAVIGSAVGANMDAIQNDISGYLVRTENEWYNALKRLIENHKKRIEMGEAGFNLFKEKYEIKSTLQHINDIIRQHI
ncbi:MAG: glycosyltransferase family 4 protein [Calditrichaeota bacterium]|nr:glycosyltransferase family 4 protein [Calditrichota bacterium]